MYQIFTRTWNVTRPNRPRRYDIANTIEEARAICTGLNDGRTSAQKRKGFAYEFTTVKRYQECWGR